MKKQLLIAFCLLFTLIVKAQESDSLSVVHHYEKGVGLMFKWLPANQDIFFVGAENGYHLSRAEVVITKEGKEQLGDFVLLHRGSIRPWTEATIKERMKTDSTLVTAAILLTDSLKTANRPVSKNGADALQQAEADQFLAFWRTFAVLEKNSNAEAMGLYYADNTINEQKKYVYKLEMVNHPEFTKHVIIFPVVNYQMEKVLGVKAELDPKTVTVSWNLGFENMYPYYNIYRSTKPDKNYKKLNKRPYIGMSGNAVVNTARVAFTDSFPSFNQTYYYKVIGVNAFEKEGIPCDPVKIVTHYIFKEAPRIDSFEVVNSNDVKLYWEVPEQDAKFIESFKIFRCKEGRGNYHLVSDKVISGKVHTFTDISSKGASNYYKVCAYAVGGDSICSLLKAVLLVDSIPPSTPIVVEGICDTLGVVRLKWNKPPEDDVLGYRVFRTYYKQNELDRVYAGHITDTIAVDTISLKEAYNKIYYRVSAIDQMANPSPLSEFFEVKIPDFKPPVNGFIKDYKVTIEGIKIDWVNSSAYDLNKMYLLRKEAHSPVYDTILVMKMDNLLTQYLDKETASDTEYTYALLAQDENGLFSDLSRTFTIKQMDKRKITHPTDLQAIVSAPNQMIKLVWNYQENAPNFRIFRAYNNEPLGTYTFVKGNQREFYDKDLKPNSTYKYVIVAELSDGGISGYSNIVQVKY